MAEITAARHQARYRIRPRTRGRCGHYGARQDDGRTIITADLDYPRLLALGRSSEPSLILFRDGVWTDAEVIERMAELLSALTAAEIERSIIVVERHRIRRRRLPIVRSNADE